MNILVSNGMIVYHLRLRNKTWGFNQSNARLNINLLIISIAYLILLGQVRFTKQLNN